MDLTPRASSPFAASRRRLAHVLAVMTLVLAVAGVHVVCSVHLDEHTHAAVGEHGVAVSDLHAVADVGPAVAEVSSEPAGDGAHGCADHGTTAGQSDPVRPAPQGPAPVPALAVRWLVPDLARNAPQVVANVTSARAPSLHALGICRT